MPRCVKCVPFVLAFYLLLMCFSKEKEIMEEFSEEDSSRTYEYYSDYEYNEKY